MLTRRTPLYPALSPHEVRAQLRATGDEETALIESYILAAQSEIESHCERALSAGKFELVLPCWPLAGCSLSRHLPFADDSYFRNVPGAAVHLEMPPVLKVASIQYYDADNTLQSLEDWDLCNLSAPGELRPAIDETWPTVKSRWDAIKITFWAGHVIPLELDAAEDQFISISGYPFADDDQIVISKSGNVNEVVGDVAVLPSGVSAATTYHVVNASGNRFQIAASSGGSAISLGAPTASGQAIQLLFAGTLEPMHRLILLHMAARSWGARCPQGGCACSGDDFHTDPLLRKLKWRSPVESVG